MGEAQLDGYSLVFAAAFDARRIGSVRRRLGEAARGCGLTPERADVFLVAVNEIMTNAVRHGGGVAELRLWEDHELLCEVDDRGVGFPADAYLDRTEPPTPTSSGGMGLWLAQQTSDRLAIDSGPAGTTVRLGVFRPDRPPARPLRP
jgi:anti-sigma regulatory factor (Ser/Thr protein kinase)